MMNENPTREQLQKEIATLRSKAVSSEATERTPLEARDFPVLTPLPHRAVVENLTKRKGIEKKFNEIRGALPVLINFLRDGAFIVDIEEKILRINRAMSDRLGKRAQDVVGTTLGEWMDDEEIRLHRQTAREAVRQRASVRFEHEHKGHLVEDILYPIVNLMGNVTSIVVIVREMTQGRARKGRVTHLEANGRNAGLPKVGYLEEITCRAVELARKGSPSSLVYLNLDNFEYIDSLIGRTKSSEVLIMLSGLLKSTLRAGDIMVRIDEARFVFVLPGVPAGDAAFAAHRLQFAVNTFHFLFEGRIYYLGNSMSLVEIDGTLEAPMLLSLGDEVSREARKKGMNGVVMVKEKKQALRVR